MKKAQAAMEFLMTYGWAIMVVLIAIGSLAYFGVLTGKFLPDSCTFFPGVACVSFKVISDPNNIPNGIDVVIVVQNGLGNNLEPFLLTLVGDGTACNYISQTDSRAGAHDVAGLLEIPNPNLGPQNVNNGEIFTFGFDCDTSSQAPTKGTRFKSDIIINYGIGGIPHKRTGTIVAEVE